MKYLLSLIMAAFVCHTAYSQIVITASDMPVAGDMLGYVNAATTGTNFNPGDSGANVVWSYSLSPTSKGGDTFKTAAMVNLLYAVTVSPSAFGYKVADSIPGLSTLTSFAMLSITVSDIYTFFQEKTTPSAVYAATAYAYLVNSILPAASKYTKPDIWYFFPLTYGNGTDSADYELTISLMSTISIKEAGNRKTRVDGWGTITTPYYTTPVNCIRVRSEIHEIDSITFSGFTFGVPRNTVEYKWLVNGAHYPALWITSNLGTGGMETINTVRYGDSSVSADTTILEAVNEKSAIYEITAFPNPAANGIVTLRLPEGWKTFEAEVFDMQSKEVAVLHNEREINMSSLPAGQYLVRVTSGAQVGYARIARPF